MLRLPLLLLAGFALIGNGLAQKYDWQRERNGKTDEAKNALEGKQAPSLTVDGWMNTDGKAIDLAALKGKVVVLDFWGTW